MVHKAEILEFVKAIAFAIVANWFVVTVITNLFVVVVLAEVAKLVAPGFQRRSAARGIL